MPRKSPLPQREHEIAERLKWFRERTQWSQRDLATEMSVSRDAIANVEYGRVALRYDLGVKLCSRLNLNQRWVATAKLPMRPYFVASEEPGRPIPPGLLFSDVYDRFLAERMDLAMAVSAQWEGMSVEELETLEELMPISPVMEAPEEVSATMLQRIMPAQFRSIPEHLHEGFSAAIRRAAREFLKGHEKEVAEYRLGLRRFHQGAKPEVRSEKSLPVMFSITKTSTVKPDNLPEWEKLKRRLVDLTGQPGMKSKLAELCGVSPSAVSQWLAAPKRGSKTIFPRAETALFLRQWADEGGFKNK